MVTSLRSRLRGLPADAVLRLALWKGRGTIREAFDWRSGYRRYRVAGERWAASWRATNSSFREWLTRQDAGKFWVDPSDAVRWARETHTSEDQELADASVRGVFDLLGSGPVELGQWPSWRRDLYSGYEWPLQAWSTIRIQRGDGSDIRTVWEASRGYHLVSLARAYWNSGNTRFRETFQRHLQSWIENNPVGMGPNWASPMDLSIRAANWILAGVLFSADEEIPTEFWRSVLGNLFSTAAFIDAHLEWHPVYRGNHFVSNAVGLVYLGTLFRGTREGERWLRRGSRLLGEELLRQVHEDGVSFEASLAYHRLVTEFFSYAAALVKLNRPEAWQPAHEERLRLMYRFIDTYLPSSGHAPMLGDADDGRLHAVSARALREPRQHRLGLLDQYWPSEPPSAEAYRLGGFYVLREGDDHCVVRCGPVGLMGVGSHDHNDQLSFELVTGGRRVVADSGTYAYTRDLQARFGFRSTAAHNAIQLGAEEQNPIAPNRPWRVLDERTRAVCTQWNVDSLHLEFAGRHFGFAHRPSRATVDRKIDFDVQERRWTIVDRVEGVGREPIHWRLHLTEGSARMARSGDAYVVVLAGEPEVEIHLRVPSELVAELTVSDASDRYGERYSRPSILVQGETALPLEISATIGVKRAIASRDADTSMQSNPFTTI